MTDAQLLTAVKVNLKISTTAYDDRLTQLISAAKSYIIREGASTLDASSSAEDAQLIIMYAAWLWSQRDNPAAGMPRMLRWALNNRVLGEKAGAGL